MSDAPHTPVLEPSPSPIRELAVLFLKLGVIGFGGPAAHIAMMQEEVVQRRKWLSNGEFLDMLAATNFIPGPNSTEMAIHIGYRRGGWKGLVVAGSCFILPAAILCGGLAALYVAFGTLPAVEWVLYGVKPVVIAIVGVALFRLMHTAVKSWVLGVWAVLAAAALFLGWHELVVLFAIGGLHALVHVVRQPRQAGKLPLVMLPLAGALPATVPAVGPSLAGLFLVFLKIGSVLFGSGYVLLAFLQADLVDRRGWLTQTQLLDAVAVGQVTPGPLFTTATFVGYVIGGPMGAVVATVGIFLPAFVFVAASAPLLPLMRRSALFGAFLDGLNVASLALMAVVTWRLALLTLLPAGRVDVVAVVLVAVSLGLLLWKKWNTAWLVLGGALVGIGVKATGYPWGY